MIKSISKKEQVDNIALTYKTGFSSGSQRRATEIMNDLMEYSDIIECEDMRQQLVNYAKEKKISCNFNV